ncbi:hypothetical protein [Candidatus Vidania fulgoroideorum]
MNLYFKEKKKNIEIPGSKSYTNRVILFSFLCFKKIIIKNPLISEDTIVMLNNLKNFKNFNFFFKKNKMFISNNYPIILLNKKFYFKNAGTVARPLLSLLFFLNFNCFLNGNKNMRKRPIKGLVNILNNFNKKKIIYLKKKYFFPLLLKKKKIKFKKKKITINENLSSQFLTSLIIGLSYKIIKPFYIKIKNIISLNYILFTIKLIKKFNINIKFFRKKIIIYPSFFFLKKKISVPKDIISQSYFFYNKIINKKILFNFNINQNEIEILNFFKKIGFYFYKTSFYKFIKFKKKIYYLNVNCCKIIDSSMIISTLIFDKIKKIKLFNIYNWNFKECNRIIAIAKEIKKLGGKVLYGKNWIILKKFKIRKKIIINTYNDHRIAMIFKNYNLKKYFLKPNCVKKTFPLFLK